MNYKDEMRCLFQKGFGTAAEATEIAAMADITIQGLIELVQSAYMEGFERAAFDVSGGRGANRFGRWEESQTKQKLIELAK